jgi:hypothetical protein
MFHTASENKIINVNVSDILLLLPENAVSLQTPSVTNFPGANSIDVRALALNIVLLRLKKTYINRLNAVLCSTYATFEERQADVGFLVRNIATIDKYLKNVLLKLRLRFERDFG